MARTVNEKDRRLSRCWQILRSEKVSNSYTWTTHWNRNGIEVSHYVLIDVGLYIYEKIHLYSNETKTKYRICVRQEIVHCICHRWWVLISYIHAYIIYIYNDTRALNNIKCNWKKWDEEKVSQRLYDSISFAPMSLAWYRIREHNF